MNSSHPTEVPKLQWVRASDGLIAGVCKGISDSFGMPAWALRVAWLILLLWFGTGAILYVICVLALPREDKIPEAMNGMFFGVCARIAKKYDFEVGLVRLITILLFIGSAGFATVGYFVAAMILSDDPRPSLTREERHEKFYGKNQL